jgi:hypothetical protein
MLPGSMYAREARTHITKGGCYALDDRSDTDNSVGAGAGEQLHDWRIHSYTAGYRNRCGADQNNSGTKTSVDDLQVSSCRSYIY